MLQIENLRRESGVPIEKEIPVCLKRITMVA